jgi:molybdopterin-guanine dinucleotide biosynthesis protein A
MAQRVGLVLAGGGGHRLGRAKGGVELEGRTLAQRAAETVWPLCGSVLISVGPGASNPAPGYPAVEDDPPGGRGPLAGLDAAFRITGEADLIVLACDYPNAGTALLRRLLSALDDAHDLVLPTDRQGRDHPLVAVWRRSSARRVAEAVGRDRLKVRALLVDLAVRRLGPAELADVDADRELFNVNWPDDMERVRSGSRDRRPGG